MQGRSPAFSFAMEKGKSKGAGKGARFQQVDPSELREANRTINTRQRVISYQDLMGAKVTNVPKIVTDYNLAPVLTVEGSGTSHNVVGRLASQEQFGKLRTALLPNDVSRIQGSTFALLNETKNFQDKLGTN